MQRSCLKKGELLSYVLYLFTCRLNANIDFTFTVLRRNKLKNTKRSQYNIFSQILYEVDISRDVWIIMTCEVFAYENVSLDGVVNGRTILRTLSGVYKSLLFYRLWH